MSMIRSAIGTDPEVLRHHPLAQRVAGAECRDQFSRPFSSRENYFLLTFPLIEPQGGSISLGGAPHHPLTWRRRRARDAGPETPVAFPETSSWPGLGPPSKCMHPLVPIPARR